MGSKFYQVKIGLYVFVILMVGILFAVRVNNAWQKTNYSTDDIFQDGDVHIFLHYPVKILSAKNDASSLLLYLITTPVSQHLHIHTKFPCNLPRSYLWMQRGRN